MWQRLTIGGLLLAGAAAWLAALPGPLDPQRCQSASWATKGPLRAGELREHIGAECGVIASGPFVLASDLSPQRAERWLHTTIEPARQAMQSEYGLPSPREPVTLVLLQTEEGYARIAEQLHGSRPPTRFGYYRPGRRTIVANLEHGAGPILHELTHALWAPDSQAPPAWLDEGLASLHEACLIRRSADGWRIEAKDNWRLAVLRRAIASGGLAPLCRLIERGEEYRRCDEAIFYAHARYFCIFLQERSALAACVREAMQGAPGLPSREQVAKLAQLRDAGALERAFLAWAKAR